MNDEKPDIIICFGKMLFTDSKPDWLLESRLNKTIEIVMKHPQVKIK